jgi:hypothetical protein
VIVGNWRNVSIQRAAPDHGSVRSRWRGGIGAPIRTATRRFPRRPSKNLKCRDSPSLVELALTNTSVRYANRGTDRCPQEATSNLTGTATTMLIRHAATNQSESVPSTMETRKPIAR